MKMNAKKLMHMGVSERTDYLEKRAHAEGLKTAPNGRLESEILAKMMSPFPGADPDMLTKTVWAFYFKAPILLYRMLMHFHPHLLQKSQKTLRVLYLGAGKDEACDQGRWYSLAWRSLGLTHQQLEITAVGPELAFEHTWETSEATNMVRFERPVMLNLPGTLEDAFPTSDDEVIDWDKSFDVAVMHHPGFVANIPTWGEDDAFIDLSHLSRIPIVGTSYDAVDFAYDKQGLAYLGRTVESVYWNSAAHIYPAIDQHPYQTRYQWGAVMWSARQDPDNELYIEQERYTPLQQSAIEWQRFNHPLSMVDSSFHQYMYFHYICPMQLDAFHQFVYATEDILINCATGKVRAFGMNVPQTSTSMFIGFHSTTLEERLFLFPSFMRELFQVLDIKKVDKYIAEKKSL